MNPGLRRRLPLLLLAAVLVGAFAFHAYRAEHPTSSYQSADERSYGNLALTLAEEHRYGYRASALHWPPGAPALFAIGHELFPDERSLETKDIPAAYWLQAVVSVGTVLAAAGLAWALAGAWAGVAAGALVGFYPPLILATGEQLSEPLGAFFVTAGFFLLALAVTRRWRWAYAGAGAVLGLAVLTRADLVLVPFLVAGLAAAAILWRRRRAGLRSATVTAGLIAGGAVLVLAPWTWYASDRAGEFVPVTTGSASALFVGTYLPGNGTTVGMKRDLGDDAKRLNPRLRDTPDFDLQARSVLAVVAARHPDLDFDAAVRKEARENLVRYGLKDPLDFGVMMLNKVQRMWTRYARGGARHTSWQIRVWHIVLVGASAIGLVLGAARRRSLVLAAAALAILYSTALHTLVVSQARYNLPLMPLLVAAGVAGWAFSLRSRRSPAPDGEPQLTFSQLRTRSLESLNTRS